LCVLFGPAEQLAYLIRQGNVPVRDSREPLQIVSPEIGTFQGGTRSAVQLPPVGFESVGNLLELI
jgi:hypothetical protein